MACILLSQAILPLVSSILLWKTCVAFLENMYSKQIMAIYNKTLSKIPVNPVIYEVQKSSNLKMVFGLVTQFTTECWIFVKKYSWNSKKNLHTKTTRIYGLLLKCILSQKRLVSLKIVDFSRVVVQWTSRSPPAVGTLRRALSLAPEISSVG